MSNVPESLFKCSCGSLLGHFRPAAFACTLAGIGLAATCSAQANCDAAPGVTRVKGRNAVVAFKTQPAKLKVGELFALDATVCANSGLVLETASLKVDATMPEHRHGMNYQASVVKKDGAYQASGLMFHMPGRWQLVFDVDTQSGRERLFSDYRLD